MRTSVAQTLMNVLDQRRQPSGSAALLRGALLGAASGAAGTTALDATTYLDMAVRGRPASSTPEDTIEKVSAATHVPVPGQGEDRQHRLSGIAALGGLAAGVAAGAVLGIVRAAGWRPRPVVGVVAATTVAMLAGNAPHDAARGDRPAPVDRGGLARRPGAARGVRRRHGKRPGGARPALTRQGRGGRRSATGPAVGPFPGVASGGTGGAGGTTRGGASPCRATYQAV